MWPDHSRSGLPERHDPGLTRIDDPEAWSALFVESSAPDADLFGRPKRRRVLDQDLLDLGRANDEQISKGGGPLTSQETFEWAAKRGLSRDSARTLRAKLPAELKRTSGDRRR